MAAIESMVEQLKVSTMRWIETPRIYQDAVDAAMFQAWGIVGDTVIQKFVSERKIVSIVDVVDIGCEATSF
jgi:hypothetical protein